MSGARVYLSAVAPLAQRLEQRPFKSWVVGSNPTGGTLKASASVGAFLVSPWKSLQGDECACSSVR